MNEIEAKQKELLELEGNNSRTHLKIALIKEGYEMARKKFLEKFEKWAYYCVSESDIKRFKQSLEEKHE